MGKLVIYCDSCHQPMKQVRKQSTTPKRSFRIRTFRCELCNINQAIYADGYRDENAEQAWAAEEVTKMYKQQERNNICKDQN